MPVIFPEQHHAAWLGETDDDPSLWESLHAESTQKAIEVLELLRE
jgi:hypothetical protein